MNLEPIDPETALELYLTDRENEVTQATLYSHRSRLGHFIRWCDEQEITNLNELTGRQLYEYRLWRRSEGNLEPVTEKTQIDTLRVFIRWLEHVDGVEPDLSTKVKSPSLDEGDNIRDVMLSSERADTVLNYLWRYEYATLPHVTLVLLWHSMMRIGAARALDLQDYHASEQYIEVRHRPDQDTPLKNKADGERLVAISDDVRELLDDWIDQKRPDTTDAFGRDPLLATSQGRVHQSTLRDYVYRSTRPCVYAINCPHDRSPDSCEAMHHDRASKCPSSVSPHAIRRGSITHSLVSDIPGRAVSDRADVSEAVIDKHYDQRTERERMEQRREYLRNL